MPRSRIAGRRRVGDRAAPERDQNTGSGGKSRPVYFL